MYYSSFINVQIETYDFYLPPTLFSGLNETYYTFSAVDKFDVFQADIPPRV